MNIRKYLEFVRSAEDGLGTSDEPVDNALSGDTTVVEGDPQPEPVADPEPTPAPVREHGNKGKTPWYMERINEETNKRRTVEERAAQVERERDALKALVERLQAGDKNTPVQRREEIPDIDALVDARAARKLFDADCNDVASAWGRDNAAFGERLAILQGAGVMPGKDGGNTDFLMDVIAIDKANAHKILDSLASDPDRAIALHRMDSRRRVAELTRMTMAETSKPAPQAAKPAAISKVPAPKPVLEAVRSTEEIPEDEMSDAQWSAWRKKQMAKSA